jgi:gamma-glutamyltranspeptidase/glutathione hydrolase
MTTTTRPVVAGPRHAVSAGHYLAAAAGLLVLEAGGNAVDAGVAAGLALGVVQPDIVNVGGVAPILVRRADGRTESIAGWATGRAPSRPTCSWRATAGASRAA